LGSVSGDRRAWWAMWLPVLALALGAIPGSTACAQLRGLDGYTIGDAPAGSDAPAPATPAEPSATSTDAGSAPLADAACTTNRACTELAAAATKGITTSLVPTVCVASTGRCEALTSEDCPRVYGDYTKEGAIVVGTLLSDPTNVSALERAALLAAAEIDESGGLPSGAGAGAAGRPIVLVGCNAGADVRRATRHLSEALRVPAIIGPRTGEQVVDATQQVTAKAGTLLMTPTSTAIGISNLADDDLTWRTTPSDAQRAKLVIQQLTDLEVVLRDTRALTSVKLGIVLPENALGTSARDAISGSLILNGRFISDAANASNVSVDAYAPDDGAAQAAIATKYATTFRPDLVLVTSAEQIANVVVPMEAAMTAARITTRPYYVLSDASKTQALLDAVAAPSMPADIRRRVRGIGVAQDTGSSAALAGFRAAFAARYGASLATDATETAAGASYDAMYAIAYALATSAAKPPTGATVAHGLRSLAVGAAVTAGPTGLASSLHALAGGQSVSLRGTFGSMQWDANGDTTGGTLEVWCVGSAGGAPSFGSSGLTMDVRTQVVGGAFVQCQ
jgi:branched-chain amino acid transport system substrate-binding protein